MSGVALVLVAVLFTWEVLVLVVVDTVVKLLAEECAERRAACVNEKK